jgi:phosphocarrier protein
MKPPLSTAESSRTVTILNKLGMHARAAVKFVQTANRFRCEVKVVKDDQEANGKSIMGLLTLVAAHGVSMTIVCAGDDAPAAVDALAALVGTGFGEGIDP